MTLKNYIDHLIKNGNKIVFENSDYYWVNYEKRSVSRAPAFILWKPTKTEISEVFKILKPLVVTYNIESPNPGDSNAFLYITKDQNYSLENITRNGRRDARIAQRNLEFKFVDWDHILKYGYQAFSDTRSRHNLSDGTREDFERIIAGCKRNPASKALAAFKPGGDEIYAFLQMLHINDWLEISGSYSMTEHLAICPNNGLFDFVLDHYLTGGIVKTVSFGVSSLQRNSKKEGLHNFKTRVGFYAKPIKRVFIVNPHYDLFINKISHMIVRLLLKAFPSSRRLRKIDGVIGLIRRSDED